MRAHLDWLRDRWGLPDAARSIVEDLLRAEAAGSTALRIGGDHVTPGGADFGGAASEDLTLETPIVIVRARGTIHIQSRALHDAEARIASRLCQLAGAPPPTGPAITSHTTAGLNPEQLRAVHAALGARLTLLTGGPGTGKTFIITRLLAALTSPAASEGHLIRLAAPTGKAADRIRESLTASLDDSIPEAQRRLLEDIAAHVQTLHSLLGFHPATGECQAPPLPEGSTLIVDECSMVDIHLWDVLLSRLPEDIRLILAGDPNQLESVGQGAVFAELTRTDEDHPHPDENPNAEFGGRNAERRTADSHPHPAENPLAACHAHLTQSQRFGKSPAIPELVAAFEEADTEAVVRLLEANQNGNAPSGIAWIPHDGSMFPLEAMPEPIVEALEGIASASSPEEAFTALDRSCILTAQRRFFVGAQALNQAISAFLLEKGLRYQPVIINRNDPETGLRNGSVGVLESGASPRAWFRAPEGHLRPLPLDALPDFSPAWAITIHRSQGSEYDQVLVILPREDSPLATRELLYTAITRARKTLFIAGNLQAIRKAVETPSGRVTLLGEALRRKNNGPQKTRKNQDGGKTERP